MLITPYGEDLVNLNVVPDELVAVRARAEALPSIVLSQRAICDLELLAFGGFSPLTRFMGQADYERVVHEMRLADGRLFPIPITLPGARTKAARLDSEIALRSPSNEILGVMKVEEIYEWNPSEFANRVLQTSDSRHPLVAEMRQWGELNLSGPISVIALPKHFDFQANRLTPLETRAELMRLGKPNVVAFQTRNPFHRAHEEMTKRAIEAVDGVLLLHPVVGMVQPGDVDYFTRVRSYRALLEGFYPRGSALLGLLPLAMRMAGPREALWHAIVRRNYGANHLIVGRDHASPGNDSRGRPFYGPVEAQDLVGSHSVEIGVTVVPFEELLYLPDEQRYEERRAIRPGVRAMTISGTQIRNEYLNKGRRLPSWFTRPEVAEILEETYPPSHRQGFVVWFTGLSGAGKSTTAQILVTLLLERGRQVTLLDGDVVRNHLSQGLGFTKEDRDTNVLRIGFVAAEIARHGGVAVCAAISPYRTTRDTVRLMVGSQRFIEVFVNTSVDVCAQRDAKGLYAKAGRGELTGLTGIDDPYEVPLNPESVLDGAAFSAEQNALRLVDLIADRGWVRDPAPGVGLADA